MSALGMEQAAGLALLALVGFLAWPRMRSHRWLLPALYRGGQLLLLIAVLTAGTAVVFPWELQSAMAWVQEHTPEAIASGVELTPGGLLIVGSMLLLILLAPLAAWHETRCRLEAVLSDKDPDTGRPTNSARPTASLVFAPDASDRTKARPREELQVLIDRMKQS